MKAQYPNLEGGHLLILKGIKAHYNSDNFISVEFYKPKNMFKNLLER